MARSLHFPADLNLENPRPLAPQWMTGSSHDTGAASSQSMNSSPVELKTASTTWSAPGQKSGTWSADEGQKNARETWRSDKELGDHGSRPWAASTDHIHQPGQQDRFAPQLGRPKPTLGVEGPPLPAKTNERWRDDGQTRLNISYKHKCKHHADSGIESILGLRWGHMGKQEHGTAPWGSPGQGTSPLPSVDNWARQRAQRPDNLGTAGRADGRWVGHAGGWANDEHRGNWDVSATGRSVGGLGPVVAEQGRDALGAGRGRGFNHFGRGRPLGGKDPATGASYQRWHPGQAAQPSQEYSNSRGDDIIVVPKLGTGPQRYKYNIEQMLSIYVSLTEGMGLPKKISLDDYSDQLPDQSTEHQLLAILEGISQQMVEAGFASKAERRLASRLHNLLEASVPHQPEEPPAGDENLKPMIPQSDSPSTKASKEKKETQSSVLATADEWYYLDPAGNIQGPYKQQDIEDWHDSGFFPLDLPISRTKKDPHYTTLQEMLKVWRGSPEARNAGSVSPSKVSNHQSSMQIQKPPAQTAASMRLDAAETGLGSERQLTASGKLAEQSSPPERPPSHPYLEQQIQSAAESRNSHDSGYTAAKPIRTQDEFSALASLNAQLSSLGVYSEQHPPGNTQDQLLRALQGQAVSRENLMDNSLLSRLQGLNQAQHPQFSATPDPIINLISSITSSHSQSQDAPPLAPIGPSMRPSYQPPHAAYQHQSSQLHVQPRFSSHMALPDVLGIGQNHPLQDSRTHEQLNLSQSSYGHYNPPLPLSSQQFSHQPNHHQQPTQLQQQSSHTQLSHTADLRPRDSRELHQQPYPLQMTLNHWLPQSQPQTSLQQFPSEPVQSRDLQADRISQLLNSSPPKPMDPPRHAVDKILSPSQLAPPPAAAVGPPPRKLPGVEGPPPKKLATAVSAEEHPQSKDTTPFQKVQRQKRREAGSVFAEVEPQVAPPPRKTPAPVSAEPKISQEIQRPAPTLAEAAGLREAPSMESEASSAPWSSVQATGGSGKSIIDIQREEWQQAKRRAAQDAAVKAEKAAAAASAPSQGPTSWGKAVSHPAPPSVPSFAEIQEQERRRAVATGPTPPAAPLGPPPSWAGSQSRASTLADRLQRDNSTEHEHPRKIPTQPSGPKQILNPPKLAAPKAAATKPARQAVAKPVEEVDDDMFWDYGPQNPSKDTPVSKPASERKSNGTGNGRQAVSQKVSNDTQAEDGFESLSPEFANWCKIHLRQLRDGDDDLTLVQYLMTVASNAEVAEYMTEYLGKTAAVSAFSNEFIKRKLAEQNGRKKGKASKKAQGSSLQTAGSGVGVAPITAGGATGWSKMPKKKKKGQKVDAAMLGFATGTNYAALEKLEG